MPWWTHVSSGHQDALSPTLFSSPADSLVSTDVMIESVTLKKAFPAIFTKLNFRFMSVDIPVKKHASSSLIYSLNVAPFHLPIFYICVSL